MGSLNATSIDKTVKFGKFKKQDFNKMKLTFSSHKKIRQASTITFKPLNDIKQFFICSFKYFKHDFLQF